MKVPNHKQLEEWLLSAGGHLSPAEFKVFVMWLTDKQGDEFSACASVLADRAAMSIRQVRRCLDKIIEKKYLIKDGSKPVNTNGGTQQMTMYALPSTCPVRSAEYHRRKDNGMRKSVGSNQRPPLVMAKISIAKESVETCSPEVELDYAASVLIEKLTGKIDYSQIRAEWTAFFNAGGTESYLKVKINETHSDAVRWKRAGAYASLQKQFKTAHQDFLWNHAALSCGDSFRQNGSC
ncbi:MAG: hypothetical protein HC883_03445 [Bdellovibrionaceae bacterium]|nr:hypothetical protein [Pseudobdellovibrionaceae bacterium]